MSKRSTTLAVAVGMLATAFVAVAADKADEGYLGVFLEPVPQILAVHLGLGEGVGVVAGDVAAESPADKAGIAQFDVIVSLNGKEVKGQQDISAAVRAAGAGSKVKLGLINKGQKKEIELTLGAFSDATGKGKYVPSKGGRRLLREGERPDNFSVPGDDQSVVPRRGPVPRFEPIPGGPDDRGPFMNPGADNDRLQALEDRIAEIERQQSEILAKLDKLLVK